MQFRIGPAARRRQPLQGATIRNRRGRRRWLLVALAIGAARAAGASGMPEPVPQDGARDGARDGAPRAACLAAARAAETEYRLPPGLLVAIALSESGLHAHALNIGGRALFPERLADARRLLAAAPPRAAVMAGCVQVNARVHARGSAWPLEAGRSADWAAALLRRFHDQTGDWTAALRRWHGGSPAGSQRVVCRVRAKLDVVAPGSAALSDAGCGVAAAARVARSGRVLLEVAEAGDR